MPKVNVLGLGPGCRSYVLPVTNEIINESQVVIGAKRNIESLQLTDHYVIELKSNLSDIKDYIVQNKHYKKISVVVSGDTGFYSLLNYLKTFLTKKDINVVPGISSLQYMYARLGLSYQNAKLTSLHGRENDILSLIDRYETVGILTDKKSSPSYIAKLLFNNGFCKHYIYVGERLSYDDESITRLKVSEALSYDTDKINVVVISKE